MLKIVGKILAGLVILVIASVLVALWVYRDIPRETLEAKYANEESEGSVHGSYPRWQMEFGYCNRRLFNFWFGYI